jgi:hypothetical protein
VSGQARSTHRSVSTTNNPWNQLLGMVLQWKDGAENCYFGTFNRFWLENDNIFIFNFVHSLQHHHTLCHEGWVSSIQFSRHFYVEVVGEF